jgi:hypothetical protein
MSSPVVIYNPPLTWTTSVKLQCTYSILTAALAIFEKSVSVYSLNLIHFALSITILYHPHPLSTPIESGGGDVFVYVE